MFFVLLALICNQPVQTKSAIDKQWLQAQVQTKPKELKFDPATSKVYLDGKETTIEKIPKGATITGLQLAGDKETIIRIDFKSP